MAARSVTTSNTLEQFRTTFNSLSGTDIGDLASLGTTEKGSIVGAINEINTSVTATGFTLEDDSSTTQTFASVNLDGYSAFTFKGSATNCASNGTIVATSANTDKYPTFVYNVATGAKTCTATTADSQKLGCTNSKW